MNRGHNAIEPDPIQPDVWMTHANKCVIRFILHLSRLAYLFGMWAFVVLEVFLNLFMMQPLVGGIDDSTPVFVPGTPVNLSPGLNCLVQWSLPYVTALVRLVCAVDMAALGLNSCKGLT